MRWQFDVDAVVAVTNLNQVLRVFVRRSVELKKIMQRLKIMQQLKIIQQLAKDT